jgi:hypothetical protein
MQVVLGYLVFKEVEIEEQKYMEVADTASKQRMMK